MTAQRVLLTAQIEDEFEGFDDGMLFQLTNGTWWIQDEYKYWYHYAYRPQIQLINAHDRIYLQVAGQNQAVAVRQIGGVIESRINGEFNGWEGDSTYELVNGQLWQQSSYKYEYKYAYMPEVVIFDPGGGAVMRVAGTSAQVRRLR